MASENVVAIAVTPSSCPGRTCAHVMASDTRGGGLGEGIGAFVEFEVLLLLQLQEVLLIINDGLPPGRGPIGGGGRATPACRNMLVFTAPKSIIQIYNTFETTDAPLQLAYGGTVVSPGPSVNHVHISRAHKHTTGPNITRSSATLQKSLCIHSDKENSAVCGGRRRR
jgi:hypothetical protein